MHTIKYVSLVLGLFACLGSRAEAATGLVLGDSIGEGVAMASGLKGLAHISVHIRGPRAVEQINQTPIGATAFLVLGTNDADGSIANLGKHIDNIIEAAARRNITLVWIGPPCVRKSWDSRARELDSLLSEVLAVRTIQYVSMRDERICSGEFHEPDGVHLKMKGYAYMWEKARAAAGFAVAAVDHGPAKVAAEPTHEHKHKKHAHKSGSHHRQSAASALPKPIVGAQVN